MSEIEYPQAGDSDEESNGTDGNDEDDVMQELLGDGAARAAPEFLEVEADGDFLCQPCAGERVPKTLRSPVKPSAEVIAEHYTTHLPYRNWCPVCAKAQGREDPHRRGANKEDADDKGAIATVGMDYNSMNGGLERADEKDAKVRTMVMKDDATGNVFQHKIVVKVAGDAWLMRKLAKDLEELGRRDVILKSDGEPSIVAVQTDVQSRRKGRTIPRNPPAYNPESNGAIEKGVRDVTEQSRTVKIGLESRVKGVIPEDSAIVEWILEHGAFLINKYSVGHDGMTPNERLTGAK